MNKDIVVAMGASRVSGMMTEYIRQLSSCGISVVLMDLEALLSAIVVPGGPTFSIATKLNGIRLLAKHFSDYEFLLCSDGWDVLFYGTKEELLAKIPRDKVLWAAEKNCWPDSDIAARIPDRGPWSFCNGGLLAGTPAAYLAMCDQIESHPLYKPDYIDQGFMNMLLANGDDFFELDAMTNLFFCLFKGYEELDFEKGRPVNRSHGTRPLFVHANGNWPADEMHRKYEMSLQCQN